MKHTHSTMKTFNHMPAVLCPLLSNVNHLRFLSFDPFRNELNLRPSLTMENAKFRSDFIFKETQAH